MGAMLLRLEGAAGAASEEVQGIIELGSMVFDPMKAVGLAQNMGQAIVHWDQTMAGIQQQMESSAYAYRDSLSGRTDPWDAYRMEGVAGYHIASFFVPGWVVKGAGKARLAGKADDVAGLVAKKISTGRTVPNSLKEKLAMEQVMAKPMGTTPPKMPPMSDTKNNLLAADGWVKRVQNVNDVEIHYVENTLTGQMVDFKFK